MTFTGRFHPLLVHFPIGLVLTAAAAELIAIMTGLDNWRAVAVANVRVGAVIAAATVASGWILAASAEVGDAAALEWHARRRHGTSWRSARVGPEFLSSVAEGDMCATQR